MTRNRQLPRNPVTRSAIAGPERHVDVHRDVDGVTKAGQSGCGRSHHRGSTPVVGRSRSTHVTHRATIRRWPIFARDCSSNPVTASAWRSSIPARRTATTRRPAPPRPRSSSSAWPTSRTGSGPRPSGRVLVVLQGIDAAGKDGTIKKVMEAFNPQGCPVTRFKVPSAEELAHDYLWRVHQRVPRKGEIGIFNRSHYEDVLVVRVHDLVPASRSGRSATTRSTTSSGC